MALLDIDGLTVDFETPEGTVSAVRDLAFQVEKGECLGIVGESGSGKSQTFLALMGLLARNGKARGRALFDGRDLFALGERDLSRIRGARMAMVFQDPMTSLTPHMRVGRQLAEMLEVHRGLARSDAEAEAVRMLKRVRIPDPETRAGLYPHEFSGGMRQRVMIAIALICQPDLLIADEPTTALDVTVQAQILDLLKTLRDESGMGIVLITHDLGVVAGLCDRVHVMYAGRFVETGPVDSVFAEPKHPYTRGLLASVPRFDAAGAEALHAIPGQPPDLTRPGEGCAFAPRCTQAFEPCTLRRPMLVGNGHRAACHLEET